ncbi:MAG: nucleotidyltransferase domain-containing protein [Bacteroidales bacterium]|jgi:predicted nucleotidyltransferase|nr:nucleotidyltransferase domain-containing protein [Bacteroidales bacterium]MCK9499847.1 nucleotidyltransferase domain-containing protein [Bacteroidales bacterium]NLP20763.1 nucleotidyltransferase domain-containing protein [Bacteroidales bacterium]HNY44645.1 nucleotidyltransferase domain-containing protein [Bacteroidales bacterium]HOD88478.1 nucleotidyltransferase domain-containing protein [Bacteroidales bacterium]
MNTRDVIISKILELSKEKYPDAEIYLYGSHARGDAKPFSDWDLLILLNLKQIPFALETKIMDEFYEIELETGEILSPLIYPKEEWNVKYRQTPLYENIKNESIRLI